MYRRKTFFIRTFVLLYVFFILLMIFFGLTVYRQASNGMKEQLAHKCGGIATAVAALIELDSEGYREFSETLDMDSEYYHTMKRSMEKIRQGNADNITFLYTEKMVSASEMMFILDGETPDSAQFSPPGEIDSLTNTRVEAYQTGALVVGDFVTTGYGTLMSAYAPIRDQANGELLGLVGVDVSIDQYQKIMGYQRMTLALSIGIMLFMIALVLLFTSSHVEKLITTDGLTGVYNKAYFLRNLKVCIRRAKKKDEALFVVMADLDHFKNINDTYGHPFGDEVLASVSKSLASVMRESDCLARYGGEEFAAFFPGLTQKNAEVVLERMRRAVENNPVPNAGLDKDVRITVSIGAAQLHISQTLGDVMTNADKALYAAKKTRNTVRFYDNACPEKNS